MKKPRSSPSTRAPSSVEGLPLFSLPPSQESKPHGEAAPAPAFSPSPAPSALSRASSSTNGPISTTPIPALPSSSLRRAPRLEKPSSPPSSLRLLRVVFRGWTASPRQPRLLSGDAVMMPVPSYSMLLGLIGCCLGREVSPQEIRLGFEYEADDVTSIDLETTHRLVLTNGRLKPNTEGTTPKKREFHSNPRLTLFLDRPDWREFFEAPVGIPCLGQSQDLLWIEPSSLLEVQAAPVTEGSLGRTLLPFVSPNLPGRLLRLVESYEEGSLGEGRTARHSERYTALLSPHSLLALPNLYHVGDALQGRALYLHAWAAS